MAHRTGAIESKDLERVVVDTTVQEKAIAHPTDARLTHRAIEKLVETAKREGVGLRQSYLRVAKRAAIMVGLCPPVQARPAGTQIPAHATWPHHALIARWQDNLSHRWLGGQSALRHEPDCANSWFEAKPTPASY